MTAPGSRFGRYEVIEPIGQGGMGTVLRARDPALGREVALKIVRADRMTPDEAAEYRARFFREARAAANLRHPNIVAIYDVGEEAGTPFLVMELLRGRTLRASIAGDTPIEQRLRWLVDVAEALAAAHAAGLVHRDVKPDNVLVGEDGVARVLDFGLAKRPADPELGAASTPDDAPTSFQTRSGVVLGTPRYMAPEQMVGALVDGRADQFSWGRMAYEVLGGVLPAASAGRTPSLSTLGYPDSLSAVVDRAVAPLPGQRFPSMAEALAALRDASAAAGPGVARAAAADVVAASTARAAAPVTTAAPSTLPATQPAPTQLDSASTRREMITPDPPVPRRDGGRAAWILGAGAVAAVGIVGAAGVGATYALRLGPFGAPGAVAATSSSVATTAVAATSSGAAPAHASSPPSSPSSAPGAVAATSSSAATTRSTTSAPSAAPPAAPRDAGSAAQARFDPGSRCRCQTGSGARLCGATVPKHCTCMAPAGGFVQTTRPYAGEPEGAICAGTSQATGAPATGAWSSCHVCDDRNSSYVGYSGAVGAPCAGKDARTGAAATGAIVCL